MALGSNVEPERNLPLALRRLSGIGRLVAVSSAYRNPAVGPQPQPEFLNAVAQLDYGDDIDPLRTRLREIEAELGRVRTEDKDAPRTIDLDPIWMDGPSEQPPLLAEVDITERAHLAIPLAELAPELRHPSSGEHLAAIAERLRPEASMVVEDEVSAELQRIVKDAESDNGAERVS